LWQDRDPHNLNVVLPVVQHRRAAFEALVGMLLEYRLRIDANTTFLQAKYDDFLQSNRVNFAGRHGLLG
jgi:iron complex outermembrane receptor protein